MSPVSLNKRFGAFSAKSWVKIRGEDISHFLHYYYWYLVKGGKCQHNGQFHLSQHHLMKDKSSHIYNKGFMLPRLKFNERKNPLSVVLVKPISVHLRTYHFPSR